MGGSIATEGISGIGDVQLGDPTGAHASFEHCLVLPMDKSMQQGAQVVLMVFCHDKLMVAGCVFLKDLEHFGHTETPIYDQTNKLDKQAGLFDRSLFYQSEYPES